MLNLDLKMPKKDGFEVLEWVRAQQDSEQLPVLMLSSSDVPADAEHPYRMGVTKYFLESPTFWDVIHFLRTS